MSQSPLPDATDDDLASACAAGDSAAFETLFHRYHTDTLRFICRIRWRTDACREPDDLNQRTWMTILAKLRAGVYDSGNFKAWIMTITRNTVLHRPRRSASTMDADPVAPGVTVLDSLLLEERRAKVNDCVEKLGDETAVGRETTHGGLVV